MGIRAIAVVLCGIAVGSARVKASSANLHDLAAGGTLQGGNATFFNFTVGGSAQANDFTVTATSVPGGTAISFTSAAPFSDLAVGYTATFSGSPMASTALDMSIGIAPGQVSSVGETLTDRAAEMNYSLQTVQDNNKYFPDQPHASLYFPAPVSTMDAIMSIDNAPVNGSGVVTNTYYFPLFVGDANGDGLVNLDDLNIVLNHLGETDSDRTDGNFDGAATVDLNDLNDVFNNLGKSEGESTQAALAAVSAPEPGTGLVLAALGLPLMFRKGSAR